MQTDVLACEHMSEPAALQGVQPPILFIAKYTETYLSFGKQFSVIPCKHLLGSFVLAETSSHILFIA